MSLTSPLPLTTEKVFEMNLPLNQKSIVIVAVSLAVIVAAGVFTGSRLLALGIAAALFIVTGVYYTVKLV